MRVLHTIGLDKAEILDLCELIHQEAVADERTWPPILGLYKSVVVTLTRRPHSARSFYLRIGRGRWRRLPGPADGSGPDL